MYQNHYLNLESAPEKLKKKFHRSCVRQRISRALKSILKVKVGTDESDLQAFYQLYLKTRKRVGLPTQPYRFFREIWKVFQPSNKLTLLLAETDSCAVSGLIILKFKDRVSAEFIASDEKFRNLSPNHLLLWEAINLAYKEGYPIFDFGRTSIYNKGLMDFKSRWGTSIVGLTQYYFPENVSGFIAYKEETKKYKLMRKICQRASGSTLKIIGEFCYPHLG